MSEWIVKQFDVTRNAFLSKIDSLDKEKVDVQPGGFNNTIHWHIGHVLTVTEQFLFGFPKTTEHISANYKDLFGAGTKPSDWTGNIPSIDELSTQLKEQLERIKQIPPEKFDEKLSEPFLGQETYGGLSAMAAFHEANHLGRIHAMEKVV